MRIFISYAHHDEETVRILAERLRKGDHDVWFDDRLVGGKAWKKKLLSEIQAADRFLYVLSPDSVESAWCQWEFSQAVHLGKRIVTVLVKPMSLEGILSETQYVDFTQGETVDFGIRLATAIYEADIISAEDVQLLEAPDSAEARRKAPESNGVRADKVFDHAYDHYSKGDYEEARQHLEICLSIDPGHPAAQALLRIIEGRRIFNKSTKTDAREISGRDLRIPPIGEAIAKSNWLALLHSFRERVGFPVPEMVVVPAGSFLMGSDPKHDPNAEENEQPQISLTLPKFFIGRNPVTVGEYQVFMENGGYSESRWWTADGWSWKNGNRVSKPDFWNTSKWTSSLRLPVIGVSWFEANAYTQWLDSVWKSVLKSVGSILLVASSHSIVMRLPTEAEWEKAARGTDGRVFPWHNRFSKDLCNTSESGLMHTTFVGRFSPRGDSPYGCADMAGNVWEWCLTAAGDSRKPWMWRYVEGPETMDNTVKGRMRRIVRGGSWSDLFDNSRAAYRSRSHPGLRYNYRGFRVVCGPPIE